jgi:hypothetical protein
MNKLVFASAMALAGMCLVFTPAIEAHGQTIQIQDPAEFNSYQNATTQNDPAQKCAALESFLKAYPQSTAKSTALAQMMDCYSQSNQPDKLLSAATRLLQIDPNNIQAIFASVYVKKALCGKAVDPSGASTDPQTCDDSAALAQKGLAIPKPASTSDADWKAMTANYYPIFHSAIAYDDMVSKKDPAGAIKEYTTELMLYAPDDCAKPGPCLVDTLYLAQAYSKPGDSRDEVKAVWFYARFWDFAPPAYKAQVEPQLDYRYKHYHGTLDGDAAIAQQISAIKAQAQATLFPPAGFTIAPAPSPQDLANKACAVGPDDLKKLNLEDKEFILVNGSQECTDRLWAVMKGQQTPVPGNVITDPATTLKVTVTTAASPKPKEYVVKLTNSVACTALPAAPPELKVKDAQDYILANGVKADTDAMGDTLTETASHLRKIEITPSVAVINVAVTQDAKDSHNADFIVNLKEPLSCKEAPAAGDVLGLQPKEMELDAIYGNYTKVAATGSVGASAQIVLNDGFVQQVKKTAPAHHVPAKPAAGHHAE